MWYLVKVKGKWRPVQYKGPYHDSIYTLLKDCGLEVDGQFGREEYAQRWADENNKEEERKQYEYTKLYECQPYGHLCPRE